MGLPETEQELYAKAKALEREGQLEEARIVYEKAVQQNPNFTKGWYNLMLLLKKMKLSFADILLYPKVIR